ncbi:MAG: hypothetical protein ACUVS2_16835 [Candidatus Flexifilum sp.]
MPPRTTETAPWQALEAQAYHAYREWPIWLVLRERELGQRLAPGRPERHPPGAAPTAAGPERPPADAPGKAAAE